MNNRLLNSLSAHDLDLLRPHLEGVELPVRLVIQELGPISDFIYFVETGVVSIIEIAGRDRIETAIVGLEGVVGVPAILGAEEVLNEGLVQVAGSAKRIRVEELRKAMAESPSLSAILLRYVHLFMAQVSQTALANGRCTVEQRLARWLLMAGDRVSGQDIALTHEFLAAMLGVRRPGVTVALHVLEGARAIRSRRSSITLLDREKLKEIAGPSYGPCEALYERVFGVGRSEAA